MSETVPEEIVHLDFEPDTTTVTEEESEKAKICQVHSVNPPYFPDPHRCGRTAVYEITVEKTCNHKKRVYMCEGHWKRANDMQLHNPPYQLVCMACRDNGTPIAYRLFELMIAWRRL